MRLIGSINDERKASIFSHFLLGKKIAHHIEVKPNTDWDHPSYGSKLCQFWIQDEDHIDEVLTWFQLFLDNPEDPLFLGSQDPSHPIPLNPPIHFSTKPFSPSSRPDAISWNKQEMGWMTRGLLGICTILFFLSHLILPSVQIPEKYAGISLYISPIERNLLFDYPQFYVLINRFVDLYGFDDLEQTEVLPPAGKRLLKQINQTSFWPGYYQLLLKDGWKSAKEAFSNYPTFEKIEEGQLWRLFTPCLLHGDLLHLFFNMLWLIVLGKQIEQRLSPFRYVIFIVTVGVISNTAQYLMSGPNFIGFSGILIGMLTFIWVRQRSAAWEGYQIDRSTFVFMLMFIFGMAFIQLLSFFIEKSFEWSFAPNIANMAHLTGGVVGYLLGRLNFFSWRHS